MYRRYYSYNDMPQIVTQEEAKKEIKKPEKVSEHPVDTNKKLFGNFEADDIILGVIILALLMDDADDTMLLTFLAAIFLTGIG